MAPELIAALSLGTAVAASALSAVLAVKLTKADRDLSDAVEERDQYKSERDLAETASATLAHAVKAQEGQIKVLGREVGEYRAKAQRVRQSALRASLASAAARKAKANGSGKAGATGRG